MDASIYHWLKCVFVWMVILLLRWRGLCFLCWGCWFQMQVDRWWDDLAISLLNQSITASEPNAPLPSLRKTLPTASADADMTISSPHFHFFHFHLLPSLSLSLYLSLSLSQTENEYRGKLLNQRWTRGDKISRCRPSLRLQSRPIKVSYTDPPGQSSRRNLGFLPSCHN